MTIAEQITKASGSNFALAFLSLPPEKRRDITNFYAFCRVVDDLADEPGLPTGERQAQLDLWRRAIIEPTEGEHLLAADFRETLARYPIDRTLIGEIISGMEMDLQGTRYETLADLQLYCFRVAGAVGLVSIEIFGYQNPSARDHARALGEALQFTNILRDVADDYRNGERIYLPLATMRAYGYSEDDLRAERHNDAFLQMMQSLADLAKTNYAASHAAIAAEDRASLRPGLIMGDIYRRVLDKMERDKFRVFSEQYRLSKAEKLLLVGRRLLFH
ncbi:MAG TPA: squalene/phytoene synthase family protein [Chthoniobacterales bacterium]|jgi:phytoene synthase